MLKRECLIVFTQETPMPYRVFSSCFQETFKDGDSVEFVSPLQYLQYHKARLFGDVGSEREIMQLKHPADLRRVGRQVKPFDDTLWDSHKERIALEANLMRFRQNEQSRMILLNTLDKTLIEANPYNYTWACGLSPYDADVLNPDKWTGLNLWGQSLMRAREILKAEFA